MTGAAVVDRDRLVRTFLELVAVDGPTGREERIGEELKRRFWTCGASARSDERGNPILGDVSVT